MDIFLPNLAKLAEKKDIPGLIKALHCENALFADGRELEDIHYRAMMILVGIGAPAVDALIQALQSKNMKVREHVARALGEIKDPRAVDALCATLNDPEYAVKGNAATALEKIRDPRAVEPLMKAMLKMEGYNVEWYGSALAELGAPGFEALLKVLREGVPTARAMAAAQLSKIGDPQAVSPLVQVSQDEDKAVRESAVKALYLFKNKSAQAAKAIDDWHKKEFTDLEQSPKPEIRKLIYDLLFGDSDTCYLAVNRLGKLYDYKARAAVETILEIYDTTKYARILIEDALRDRDDILSGPYSLYTRRLETTAPGLILQQWTKAILKERGFLKY